MTDLLMTNSQQTNDDFDLPWKAVLDGYLDEFIAFYFPDIHNQIDWTQDYESLDSEFQSIVRDADVGKHRADKLVKVISKAGEAKIYVHIEVQSQKDDDFEKRMYTYNYRIFDKYGQNPVSLAVLADENSHWKPSSYHVEQWGFESYTKFPTVKLLDYADQLEALQASDNAFAILTAAHILTKRTKKNPDDRLIRKITLVRLLYRNGWDRQKVLNFFAIIDWLMYLPKDLTINFRNELNRLEEEQTMRYVTSIEQLAMAEGMQQGEGNGMIKMFLNMLNMRFPSFDLQVYKDKVFGAAEDQLNRYSARLFTAQTPEEVFADDDLNEKK
jgi:hypothetical protein